MLGDYRVAVKYIHSVQRGEVVEVLRVNSSGLYLERVLWRDFGAGLPEDVQYIGNNYYVKEVGAFLGRELEFWFIPLNNAEVFVNGEPLLSLKREALIKFEVKECSLFEVILHFLIV